jgi:O-6-methylguanine DNA methyltransferase
MYVEIFSTLKESRSREAALKRLKRHEKLEVISKSKDTITTMSSFQQKVLDVVRGIKAGSVMTYADVALHAGNKNASRAVGTCMAKNQDKTVPCHRVVKSDGSIGMYNGLQGKSKIEILKKEGVTFTKNGKVLLK